MHQYSAIWSIEEACGMQLVRMLHQSARGHNHSNCLNASIVNRSWSWAFGADDRWSGTKGVLVLFYFSLSFWLLDGDTLDASGVYCLAFKGAVVYMEWEMEIACDGLTYYELMIRQWWKENRKDLPDSSFWIFKVICLYFPSSHYPCLHTTIYIPL